MFWLHCGLFVLVIAVPGFISSADSTSKRGNACLPACLPALPACLFVYLLARFYLSLSFSLSNLSIYLSVFIHRISILSALPVYLPATQGTSSSSPFVSLIETHSFDPRLHTVNYIYRKSARRIG